MTATRDIHTTTRDGCKLIYTYRTHDREVLCVCVIDALGRFAPARQADRDDARWHLENCVLRAA